MNQPRALRPKHVPQRTCVACQRHDARRGLVRLVRLADGSVQIDRQGKLRGRGAYLCHALSCWEVALKRRAIERALRVNQLDVASRTLIEQFLVELRAEPPPASASADHHSEETAMSGSL